MTYFNQTRSSDQTKAILGVAAIHALLGYAIVSGMAVDFIETVIQPNPIATTFTPKPPPPPTPQPATEAPDPVVSQIYTPPLPLEINSLPPVVDTTTVLLPPLPPITNTVIPPTTGGQPDLTTSPGLDPVSARPRGDPARWITESDYRSVWVRQELTGTTGFRVRVGADGRAMSCQITKSSGHAVLDQATCELVSRRARFDPARDRRGEAVGGNYSSSVRWQLPE